MALAVRGPRYRVNLGSVIFESFDSLHGVPNVQDLDIVGVSLDGGQVKHVLLVPSNSKQRLFVLTFIDDGAMLKISQIEVSDRAIFSARSKHKIIPEANVVNCTLMRYQLSLHTLPFDVPNGARGVDRAGSDEIWLFLIPVKRSDGRAIF
jgi:hypothetical protein